MSIEKYKIKLEAAIYESCDKFYIGGKLDRIAQMKKHFENGDIKIPEPTPLFDPPKIIIGCDLVAEGTSDYTATYYR